MRWSILRKSMVIACSLSAWATIEGAGVALADVVQPNGATIPVVVNGLSGYLNGSPENDGIDEGIDVVVDAAVEPQVFSPLCEFNGKYIAKGGGANFAVGWYNIDDMRADGSPPLYVPVDRGANLNTAAATSDIQLLFPFASGLPPVGMRDLTAVAIRENPTYLGGLIGFVLVPNPNGTGNGNATQYHYTEHRFNTQCTLCTSPGPWYSDLIYRSTMLTNTFYLGFEDLDFRNLAGSAGVNGNDLDYEDFLFRFSGITCPEAGRPCEIAENIGSCQIGITDCDAQGLTICKAIVEPGSVAEQCDGVDNDCNGSVDDGAPCPEDQVCSHGRCVEPCGGGEFGCAPDFVCEAGLCVEAACEGVTCPDGQVCHAGVCHGACDGVVCPHDQVCRNGSCFDPCAGVMCAAGQVCVSGACVIQCGCRGCPAGERCIADSGACVEEACADVTCGVGTYCRAGTCVDLCDGVVCPAGQQCEAGSCNPLPPVPVDPPYFPPQDGASSSSSSSGGGGAGGGAGSGGAPSSGDTSSGESSSCSCRLGAEVPSASAGAGGGLVVLLLGLRRRSARRRRAAASGRSAGAR